MAKGLQRQFIVNVLCGVKEDVKIRRRVRQKLETVGGSAESWPKCIENPFSQPVCDGSMGNCSGKGISKSKEAHKSAVARLVIK